MQRQTIRYLFLALFLGLGCASSATIPAGRPEGSPQSTAQSSWSWAYEQQEEHFHDLFHELWEQWSQDSQLIEALALANVAGELYLLAEYETALEILQQAIRLLEEKRGGE